jgi:SAM-dependent methyltransferase
MSSTYTKYIERYQGLHSGNDAFLDTKGQLHKSDKLFDGKNFEEKLWKHLKPLIGSFETIRFLDYGCGKARHWHEPLIEKRTLPQLLGKKLQTFFLYDPGYLPYSLHPDASQSFNIVSCSDVMEHIPEDCVEEVLEDISWLSSPDAIVLFSIAGAPAFKSFSDGENLHCTVKTIDWWKEKIFEAPIGKFVLVYTNLTGEQVFKYGIP